MLAGTGRVPGEGAGRGRRASVLVMTGVWVSDAESALGTRVLAHLATCAGLTNVPIEQCDVAVYTGGSDPDARARRRESITAGASAIFERIEQARHLVVV